MLKAPETISEHLPLTLNSYVLTEGGLGRPVSARYAAHQSFGVAPGGESIAAAMGLRPWMGEALSLFTNTKIVLLQWYEFSTFTSIAFPF